jgi:hypothetical protein
MIRLPIRRLDWSLPATENAMPFDQSAFRFCLFLLWASAEEKSNRKSAVEHEGDGVVGIS